MHPQEVLSLFKTGKIIFDVLNWWSSSLRKGQGSNLISFKFHEFDRYRKFSTQVKQDVAL